MSRRLSGTLCSEWPEPGKQTRRLPRLVSNAVQSPRSGHTAIGSLSAVHCFAVTGFREADGLMLRGIPALTAGSGSDGLK
jgi:hypothetical protein